MLQSKRAFTLVEILIVVAIIGTVVTVPVLAFGSINRNARDTKRKQDIDKVSAGLQQYRNEIGSYPNAADYSGLSAFLIPKHLSSLPTDPRGAAAPGGGYTYRVDGSGTSFVLYATLEKTVGGNNEVYSLTPQGSAVITGVPPTPIAFISPTGGFLNATPTPTRTPTPSRTPTPDTSFARIIGGVDSELGRGGALNTTDKGYLVVGSSDTFASTSGSPYMVKFNSTGTKEWEKVYDANNTVGVFERAISVSGGYVALGSTGSTTLITKVLNDGNVEWAKSISTTPNTHYFYALKEVSGDIFVAGYYDMGSGNRALTILRFGNNGSLLAKKRVIVTAGTYVFTPRDIQATSDGLAIVGTYNSASVAGDDGFFIELPQDIYSGQGAVVETVMRYSGNGTDNIASIVANADGSFLAGGSTNSWGSGGYDGWLLQLNSSGSIIANGAKVVGGAQNDMFNSIKVGPGGYVVGGESTSYLRGSTNYGNEGMVLKILNTSGTLSLDWIRTIGTVENDSINTISYSSGSPSYFVASGTTYTTSTNPDMWLVKMQTVGTMYSCTQLFTPPALENPAFTANNPTVTSQSVSISNFNEATTANSILTPANSTHPSITNACQ